MFETDGHGIIIGEIMARPYDMELNKYWDASLCAKARSIIEKEVKQEFLDQDNEKRGEGAGTFKSFHSGDDTIKEINARWEKLCANPASIERFVGRLGHLTVEQLLALGIPDEKVAEMKFGKNLKAKKV